MAGETSSSSVGGVPPESARVAISRVLCPVDLSDASRYALEHAHAICSWYGARLTVIEVVWAGLPPIAFPGAITSGPAAGVLTPDQHDAFLAELRAFVAASGTDASDLRIVEGPILPGILRTAEDIAADFIVIGTHGKDGFDRLLLGSVTDKVLRTARCPVLTIPPRAGGHVVPVQHYRRVLCGIDFSPSSLAGLEYAFSLAQETDAKLTLVHVVDRPDARAGSSGAPSAGGAGDQSVHRERLRDLESLVPLSVRDWCTPEPIIVAGRPHEAIVALARERGADVIVMGVHGRSTASLRLFGSTTNQVIRHAECPVLTVRK